MRTGSRPKPFVPSLSRWAWLPDWLWRFNFYLGRLFFSNMDPLSHQIYCYLTLRRIRAEAALAPRSDVLFATKELRRHGYVMLPPIYPPALVEAIRKKAGGTLSNPETRLPRQNAAPDGNHYSWYVKDLSTAVPEVQELLTDEIIATVQNCMQAHIRVAVAKIYRNISVPEDVYRQRELHSNQWHFDHHRGAGLIKIFYLVNDVSDEDGPFCLQPRPRSRFLMRNGFGDRDDYRLSDSVLDDPDHMIKLTGPAGTAMVCDSTVCLHRAGKVAAGRERDILQFQLMPSTTPLAADWIKDPRSTFLSDALLGAREHPTFPTAERRR